MYADRLLEVKAQDYLTNASLFSANCTIPIKLFAKSLGNATGRVLDSYGKVFQAIESEQPAIERYARTQWGNASKVKFKIPFVKSQQARICGLVAMVESGFVDSEVSLYRNLISDLSQTQQSDVISMTHAAASRKPDLYQRLLDTKVRAINDYNILMGLVTDNERFFELTKNMKPDMAKYFATVSKMHRGNKIGISWPIPFKTFSKPLQDALYHDSVSYEIQQATNSDFGFKLPQKSALAHVVEQTKAAMTNLKKDEMSLLDKFRLARALPTAAFFMSGLDAYSQGISKATRDSIAQEAIVAAITACTPACTTVNACSEDAPCRSVTFTTSWATFFNTTF